MKKEASTGRLTPYEMVFGVQQLSGEQFPAVEEEASRRGLALERREEFTQLQRVGDLLGRFLPEEVNTAAFESYVDIIYHCFHFWKAGCPLYVLEPGVVRSLIDDIPDLGDRSVRAVSSSLYFELPQNLCWAEVVEGSPPEPVEGIFVKVSPTSPRDPSQVLLVLGMRPQRHGFSVASVTTDLAGVRDLMDPDAFRSEIPGADLADLYSLGRTSEVLLLVLRLLWYLDVYPEAIQPGHGGEKEGSSVGAKTGLSHQTVRLVDRSRG